MEYLFDLDKPWFYGLAPITQHRHHAQHRLVPLPIHRIRWTRFSLTVYYTALCGFQDLVERLIIKHPPQVNTRGGRYVTPLVAALAGKHFKRAKLRHHNGACPNVPGRYQGIPLTPCRGLV